MPPPTAIADIAPRGADLSLPVGRKAAAQSVGAGDGPRVALRFGSIPITEIRREAFPPPTGSVCAVYLTLNAEIALSLDRNECLQQLLREPRTRVSIDSQWLWWALSRQHPTLRIDKMSGSDLIHDLAAHAAAQGSGLMLLGASAQANAAAVARLRERHPTLAVSGFAPELPRGAIGNEHAVMQEILAAIATNRPRYIVLGFGADKEQALATWLAPRLDGQVAALLCFGGAIDMVSGLVRRAPLWMQRSGLEALYRTWEQPSRLPRALRVVRILPRLLTDAR